MKADVSLQKVGAVFSYAPLRHSVFSPFTLTLLLAFSVCVNARIQAQSKPPKKRIELLHADKFSAGKNTPKGANKLKGDVRLKHQEALMFCDSALLFDDNSLRAFGHVKIIESDSLTITGDSLFYNGNDRMAKLRGNVIIDNKTSILKTRYLDYNRATGVGFYYNGGEIDSRQEKIHLTSERGYYFSDQKLFHYKNDVVMKHPDYTIYTDTMHYSTGLEKTWFFGPTHIEFDNRDIYCEYGWFDQLADKARFIKNAKIVSTGQVMKGDTIEYDQQQEIGISKCNVVLIDTAEKFEVNGDYAIYHEKDSTSLVTQNMVMKQDMDGDTLFLVADTLYSYMDTLHARVIKTYHNTRFYRTDMQGRCDSLLYLTKDSLMHMFIDPVLWTEENQITADSIRLTMKNGDIDKMYMNKNAFIIAKEDSTLFNQIKGRNMVGHFRNSELDKVDVFGNGQTIYYPREEDQTLIGVNETKCSFMTIRIDSNQIRNISFYDRPTAKLTPSDDMPTGGMQLEQFNWREAERPKSREDLVYNNGALPPPPKPRVKSNGMDLRKRLNEEGESKGKEKAKPLNDRVPATEKTSETNAPAQVPSEPSAPADKEATPAPKPDPSGGKTRSGATKKDPKE